MSTSGGASPSTQKHHTGKSSTLLVAGREQSEDEDRDIQWCYRLRNLATSRRILHNQTPGGVSATLIYTHTHTDTCAHKPTVAGNTGATRVLSSTLSVLLSGRFLKFGRLEKPTDGVTSYHNVAAHTLRNTRHEYARISTNRHTHSDPHQQKCDSRVPPGDEDGE